LTDTHKTEKKGKKKLTFPLAMKEKNARSTRCRLFCSDAAGSIQSPKKREITSHVRTISLLQNAKVVSFRTIRLRVEKRGVFGAILMDFFFARERL